VLSRAAIRASVEASHAWLAGPGDWVLALPAYYIAGLMVIARACLGGTQVIPARSDLSDLPNLGNALSARRYISLVPAQLGRALRHEELTESLRSFSAVLVGGGPAHGELVNRAATSGIRVVTSYGMSETCGGCVYDGEPLTGTTVRADPEGRLLLGGPTLATGYLGRPDLTDAAFVTDDDGTRRFRTDDVGHRDERGRWHVDGRLDDLITTGGLKVAPRLVEEALTALPGIAEAVVVGTPDDQWGQVVSAAIVPAPDAPGPGSAAPTVTSLREQLRGILPPHALPRRLLVLTAIPVRGPGKPDRVAVADRFAADA